MSHIRHDLVRPMEPYNPMVSINLYDLVEAVNALERWAEDLREMGEDSSRVTRIADRLWETYNKATEAST